MGVVFIFHIIVGFVDRFLFGIFCVRFNFVRNQFSDVIFQYPNGIYFSSMMIECNSVTKERFFLELWVS